jgi:hypothetical protein
MLLMKIFSKATGVVIIVTSFIMISGFKIGADEAQVINGAWYIQSGAEEELVLFADGYFTHTTFNKSSKKFLQTSGGPCQVQSDKLIVLKEFDTKQSDGVGQSSSHDYKIDNGNLILELAGKKLHLKRLDDGAKNLAGTWKITARKQAEAIVPIHQTGPRKTLKVLTGTRFQWVAINPQTKEFFGTGGGTYSFANGKYTENIEFFSRDSTRVGASLSFNGKLENGDWHHSGKSSRGEDIYEVWSKINKVPG